jgi:hypothetical protein
MWFGKDLTGYFNDQFKVLGGFEQMIKDDVMNEF